MSAGTATLTRRVDGGVLAAAILVVAAAVAVVLAGSGGGVRTIAAPLYVAVSVPLLAAVLRRPQRGLLAIAALVPFDGLLVVIPGGDHLSGWKEVFVLIVVGATFLCPTPARRAPGSRLPGWVPGVAALTMLGLASAMFVGGQQGLLGAKIGFFYVLVAVAAWRCPLDARERDRLVTILMVTGVIVATYGIAQQVIGAGGLNELGYEYNSTVRFAGGHLRSFSTFVQPFGFGFFLMLVLLVAVPHLLDEPRRLRSRLFALAIPLLVMGLAASVVRGAWLGLAAGLAYLAVTRYRAVLWPLPLVVVAIILLPRETGAVVFSASSSHERVSGWGDNVARIVEHPLGEGIGTTGAAAERVVEKLGAGVQLDSYQPDNYYVKTAIELGVVGLWLLVLVLVAAFVTAHRRAGIGGRDGALASATAAYAVAAVVASTVSTFFEIFPMELYFWLLLTVVSGLGARAAGASTFVDDGVSPAAFDATGFDPLTPNLSPERVT